MLPVGQRSPHTRPRLPARNRSEPPLPPAFAKAPYRAGEPVVAFQASRRGPTREGDIRACVSPDVFVAFEAPKLPERRVWRTWVEGKLADFVLEITSLGTRGVDEVAKKALYAELGIREYWQFDPEGDYLEPMLQGRRLGSDGEYRPLILEQRDGALCHGSLLGLELRLEGERLRFFDPRRGEYLLTFREKEEALRGTEAALRAARANADLRRRLHRREE